MVFNKYKKKIFIAHPMHSITACIHNVYTGSDRVHGMSYEYFLFYFHNIMTHYYHIQGYIHDFFAWGGNVFSHASTKHVNAGGSGVIPQENVFEI